MGSQYAPLYHRAGMGDNEGGEFEISSFYDDDQVERLKAYTILQAMLETVGRDYLIPPEGVDIEEWRAEWREHGDIAVYTDRVAAGVLGEEPTLGIVGADAEIPDRVVLPDRPEPRPTEGVDPAVVAAEERAFQAEVAAYAAAVEDATARWEEAQALAAELLDRQDWIQEWQTAEEYVSKSLAAEMEWTVPLGDSVRVFGWDPDLGRPTVEFYEPHTYMPVLDDVRGSAEPNKVHLVWEYKDPVDEVDKVRRMTWEMLPVDPNHPAHEPGVDLGQAPPYVEDVASWKWSCLHTDVIVRKDDFEGPNEPIGTGEYQEVLLPGTDTPVPANRIPISLDELPVTHYTNDLTIGDRHFGRSLFIRAAQLLDELAGTDTDESLASQWAARPPIAVSGLPGNVESVDLTPGKGLAITTDGRMFVVDMAQNLPAIGARKADMRRQVSVALSVPEGLVGRVDANDVPSGIAFTLSFTSFQQLVGRARMARAPKHAKDGRLVQKIAIANGDESLGGSTVVYPVEMRFGSFMPQDLAALAAVLKTLRDAGLVSKSTGVAELQQVGMGSGSVEVEVDLIRHEETDKALEIADATGSTELAARWLGVSIPEGDQETDDGDEAGGNVAVPEGAPILG